MDDIVKQAMNRWPNVPYCYGWLALDRRGQWRMRNEYAQEHGLSGDPIRHDALTAFIERNYQQDERGAWFFQNGPQRVFVSLGYTPWVVRFETHDGEPRFQTTSRQPFAPESCHVDEHGNVLLSGRVDGLPDLQAALLYDHDLDEFSSACMWHGESCGKDLGAFRLGARTLPIEPILESEVPERFGFVRQPVAPAG